MEPEFEIVNYNPKIEELCDEHPWSLKDECSACLLSNYKNSRFKVEDDDDYGLSYLFGDETPIYHNPIIIQKCVKNHQEFDEECAYCYMLKYDNRRGKMLDWLECPNHKSYISCKDCPWCFLISKEKCPNHPLIIKGHCDVCDWYKFERKPYNKYDLCPKDKGRMKMNCKACSKGLVHCPIHPEEVKDACEICYFEKCIEHNERKETCRKCAFDRIKSRFVNKDGPWKF